MHSEKTSILAALTELGLGENEVQLYEILLQNPSATIPLLQQKSPFSRTMLYYILDQLEAWELITKGKVGNKTSYEAAPPEQLLSIVDEQYQEMKRRKTMVADVLGDLRSMYNLAHHKPGVRFFEGKEGFEEALFDSLTAKETIYTIADVESAFTLAPNINKTYTKKREALGLKKKILIIDTPFSKQHAKAENTENIESKFLPASFNPEYTTVQIYDGKVVYMTLKDVNHMVSIIIDDPFIYQMQKSLFLHLWQEGHQDPEAAQTQ